MSLAQILNKKSPVSESKRNRKIFIFDRKKDAVANAGNLNIYEIYVRIKEGEKFYVLAENPTKALDQYMEDFYGEIIDPKILGEIRRRIQDIRQVRI